MWSCSLYFPASAELACYTPMYLGGMPALWYRFQELSLVAMWRVYFDEQVVMGNERADIRDQCDIVVYEKLI